MMVGEWSVFAGGPTPGATVEPGRGASGVTASLIESPASEIRVAPAVQPGIGISYPAQSIAIRSGTCQIAHAGMRKGDQM